MELGRKRTKLKREVKRKTITLSYLEIRRQLVRGKDTQFDLREADLQVLKVVTFGRSCILVWLLMEVFIQPLQLCIHHNNDFIFVLLNKHRFLTT